MDHRDYWIWTQMTPWEKRFLRAWLKLRATLDRIKNRVLP